MEVADSSLASDRASKIPMYAEAGIPECWLLNLPERCIEVYKNPAQGQYQDHQVINSKGQLTIEKFNISLKAEDLLL
jgi:Uma2 family endonuclease